MRNRYIALSRKLYICIILTDRYAVRTQGASMTLGQQLKLLLQENHMTQEDLAEKLEVSRQRGRLITNTAFRIHSM